MNVTLSQSSRRPASNRNRRRFRLFRSPIGTRFFILLIFTMPIACDRVVAETELEIETPASIDFEWPYASTHPTLILEIESNSSPLESLGEGTISIELMPELAPETVARVMDLAAKGYYDGTTFHRVIPGFMIQGGDPNSRDRDPDNDGNGNPDVRMVDEFGDAPFVRGVVGMGNLGRPNSTGGQFFIMHADQPDLDGRYTAIGRVVSGIGIVDAITQVSIDRIGRWGPKDRPIENVLMKRVEIRQVTTAGAAVDAEG